jgi:hypothetical protein
MNSVHHWLVALGRGLKRDKNKRRSEEEARRDRLKLEATREQMRAEALVEVERLGMMGGRPHEMRLGTYRIQGGDGRGARPRLAGADPVDRGVQVRKQGLLIGAFIADHP